MEKIAEVSVPINLNKTFSYLVPEALKNEIDVGKRVLIPFGTRKLTGYVTGFKNKSDIKELKQIIQVLDESPLFLREDLDFFKWLSSYYMAPLSEVIKTALPPGINLKSQKRYSVTASGEQAIMDGKSKDPALLLFIKGRGDVTVNSVKKNFPALKAESTLTRLTRKGLVEFRDVVSGGGPKKRYTKEIILNDEKKGFFLDYISSLKKNAIKKRNICLFILEKGKVPYSVLNKKFGNVKHISDALNKLGYIGIKLIEDEPDPGYDLEAPDKKIVFSKAQKEAIAKIDSALISGGYEPFLLHGVTGSGKTEVYIQAAKKAVSLGKSVIILVPEIVLTPHFVRRFKNCFNKIAVMHSAIPPRLKYQYYLKIKSGEIKVVIGARSAIFAPVKEPGLIVIDEEHETTYKQDDGFKYNARDVALVKAKMKGCTVILGSATPSIESYNNAMIKKYGYLRLENRIKKSSLPEIKIIDMKDEKVDNDKKSGILSKPLIEAIRENLKEKKQSMLFLNRRGHSNFLVCFDCGETETCPNCSVSLTYHRKDNTLECHYCGFKKGLTGICEKCESSRLRPVGFGTERIYEIVKGHFKGAKIFRMDSDTMTKKDSHIDFYRRMDENDIDIVIGTQMIAKGHDFKNVTLVGILNADAGLTLPDFRSEEKCFSQIVQVSGRAGRGEHPGRVIIQTLNPENDYLNFALKGDAERFYEKELALRKALLFPPFSRMINIRIISRNERSGEEAFRKLERIKEKVLREKRFKDVSTLGPVTCPVYKIKNRFRWQMLARSKDSELLHIFSNYVKGKMEKEINLNHVKISIDVDPVNML